MSGKDIDVVADMVDAASQAARDKRRLEAELRRTRAELEAVRGVLKTVCRISAPYYIKDGD
jgi:hypothetical protein